MDVASTATKTKRYRSHGCCRYLKKLRALTASRRAGVKALAALGFRSRPLKPSASGRKAY